MNGSVPREIRNDASIAIVGMACRFPDAATPEEFWKNLANGHESIRDHDRASLRAAGVDDAEMAAPGYVSAGVPLDGFDRFDAGFFGLSPGEAKVMDPQHRLFLECAWSALEDAGHTPDSADRNIGVFAGSGMHWYLLRNLMSNPAMIQELGEFQIRHTANDKDFLATRVSYHLDLRGPSINVQTACSTSLVAVHLACQSLLSGESDLALAGGSTVEVPHNVGYMYREEEVRSPDGRCRPMDAAANGTVFGSGSGVVVLRRLGDALADGDFIHAVILGSAINNDGGAKAGYLAPSVDGQAQAIAEAIAIAGVDPGTIGYVEAHGTGTRIGDPIEIAALTQGFGPTARRQYCALGSVKSNIGHLDTAAGIAGLIKIALALRHRKLPASLHFHSANPEIDFPGSPFYVNAALSDWPSLGAPLRAGISALGVGGTNAHVVLEEAPRDIGATQAKAGPGPTACILPLSARTPAALSEAITNLVDHLAAHPELSLPDVAWTLREGRVPFAFRTAVAGRDMDAVVAQLRSRQRPIKALEPPPKVVFMFPGQGAQYPNMSRRLYEADADFRAAMDACFGVLRGLDRSDAIAALYTTATGPEEVTALRATAVTQPVLFCVEYALARSLQAKGVHPDAMIGHSLGEYVAACLAGVFTLEAALELVCARGALIGSLPQGAMLAVALGRVDLQQYLSDGVDLAGINGPDSCVCAGDFQSIACLGEALAADGISVRRVETSHAFHSQMLDPVLAEFGTAVRAAKPASVENSGVVSNVTGTWLTGAQAGSAEYWTSHLRQSVDFMAGMRQLESMGPCVYVEVGPGHTLSGFATAITPDARVVSSLPHPRDATPDDDVFAAVGGLLWAHGVAVDWQAWGQPISGRRLPLPTYPFQRQRHWVEPGVPEVVAQEEPVHTRKPLQEWFYATDWQSTVAVPGQDAPQRVLVFAGTWGIAVSLVEQLTDRGVQVVTAEMGSQLLIDGSRIVLDPSSEADWNALSSAAGSFSHIVYLWPVDTAMACTTKIMAGCFDHLLRIGKHIDGFTGASTGLKLIVATANAQQVGGETDLNPYQALVAGPVRAIPQEYPGVRAVWVDFDAARTGRSRTEIADQLMTELDSDAKDETIAWRNRRRFRSIITPTSLPANFRASALRTGGCYLITGAFGGAGQVLARHLASQYQARLLLVGRTAMPQPADRAAYLAASSPGDGTRRRIQMVGLLEASGAKVDVIALDVARGVELTREIEALGVEKIDGVFHAAGVLDDAMIRLKSITAAHRVLHPKVAGALGLQCLNSLAPEFFLYFSSLSVQAGVAGQVDYISANAFLDAFAATADAQSSGARHIAVGWSAWCDAGMAATLAAKTGLSPVEPECADLTGHPVLTWKTVGNDGRCCYCGMVTPESIWFLDQHRLRSGVSVLPGTGYIDLIAAAMRHLRGGFTPMRIAGLTLAAPLLLQPREKRLLRIEITPAVSMPEDGSVRYAIAVSSVGADPDDVLDHAMAELSLLIAATGACQAMPPADGCLAPVEAPYSHPELVFGPRWDCLTRLHAAASDAVLQLDLKAPEELVEHPLHPALLDMAIGAAQQVLAPPELRERLLPHSYGEIVILAPLTPSLNSRVRVRSGSDRLWLDVDVHSRDGELLLIFRDFELKQAAARGFARNPAHQLPVDAGRAVPKTVAAVSIEQGLSNQEAISVVESILANRGAAQIIVSPHDLHLVLREARQDRDCEPAPAAVADQAPEAFHPRGELGVAYEAPQSALQRSLATSWEAMLEISGIGIHDNFFELGGNSLLLMRLLSRLTRQSGIVLPLERALDEPTIATWSELASDIAAQAPAVPLKAITRLDRSKHRLSLSS